MGLDMNYEAEVFVDTENLSREDWLACRRKGIGGSDAAAIMGMSPFCTKRDLYYDKCGIQAVMDEEEDNCKGCGTPTGGPCGGDFFQKDRTEGVSHAEDVPPPALPIHARPF